MANGNKQTYVLSDMEVSLLTAMTNKEIKRVTSLPTGEDRANEIRLSEKATWLVELHNILSSFKNPVKEKK